MQVGTVILEPYQVPHYERMCSILERSHCALDKSPVGAGKSYVLAAIAQYFGFRHVLIVCPKSVQVSWEEVIENTQIPVVDIITYASLRGSTGRTLSHPYLVRHDKDGSSPVFAPTETFQKLIEEGTLIVFDELQNIKNASAQMLAAKAMFTYLYNHDTPNSRIVCLSGTPIDKEAQATNLLRAMGFIRHRNLHDRVDGVIRLQGADELIRICRGFDPVKTEEICNHAYYTPHVVKEMVYELFCEVILKSIGSCMIPPPLEVQKDVKNGYYVVEDGKALARGVKQLEAAAGYSAETETYDKGTAEWGGIGKALAEIELAKVPVFVRLAKKRLLENSMQQVIIFVNYTESLTQLQSQLSEFQPLVMYGKTNIKDRIKIVHAFQSGSSRLLIANTEVGGVGINLHDLFGDRPRFVYGSPSYKAISMHQATGRVYRRGTRSMPVIRWVYGENCEQETGILNVLAEKCQVLERVLEEQVENKIVFPGGYEAVRYNLIDE